MKWVVVLLSRLPRIGGIYKTCPQKGRCTPHGCGARTLCEGEEYISPMHEIDNYWVCVLAEESEWMVTCFCVKNKEA